MAKHKATTPPIIEEGKMNLTVSLVIELSKSLSLKTKEVKEFEKSIAELCYTMRLAGGTILDIQHIKLFSADTDKQHTSMLRQVKQATMPGFVLLDRSNYLKEHYEKIQQEYEGEDNPELLDAWLDFSALKFKAEPTLAKDQTEPNDKTPAEWKYVAKPKPGYLVPLMTGYKAISDKYDAGVVEATRDSNTDARFVEAIHSVGEWKGMHNIKKITDIIWRYRHEGEWYLCEQGAQRATNIKNTEEVTTKNIELSELLNQF